MGDPEDNKSAPWRIVAFLVAGVGVFELSGIALPALFPQITVGVLFASRAMIAMAAAFIVNLFDPRVRLRLRSEESGGAPIKIVGAVIFLVAMVSWSAGAIVESDGLGQPDHSAGIYTVPVDLKGRTRYLTRLQAEIESASHWIFFGCVVTGFASGFYFQRTRKKW